MLKLAPFDYSHIFINRLRCNFVPVINVHTVNLIIQTIFIKNLDQVLLMLITNFLFDINKKHFEAFTVLNNPNAPFEMVFFRLRHCSWHLDLVSAPFTDMLAVA